MTSSIPLKLDELRESKVFCTKAWSTLSISPSGAAMPCCLFEKPITDENDIPYKVWETDISEIYNSQFMEDIRSKMLAGEKVEACRQCYQVEKYGGDSLRITSNFESHEEAPYYGIDKKIEPVSLDLKLNNKCNLKCRMCQPRDSHLIEKEFQEIIENDPDFSLYMNADMTDPDLKIKLSEIPSWEESDIFIDSFTKLAGNLKKISMVGGEPLIMNQFYQVLDKCIELGVAKDIYVAVTTNLMYAPKEKLDRYLNEFDSFLFNISLDATDKALNYIRYPSDFDKIVRNFKKIYRDNPKIQFQFTPTVQVYNALYIHEVFLFVDKLLQEGFKLAPRSVHLTYVTYPQHLNIRILPESIRKRAIKNLKIFFLTAKELVKNRYLMSNYKQLINILSHEYDPKSEKWMSEFLYYSEKLDKVRGQRIQDFLPELYDEIVKNNIIATPPPRNYSELRTQGWDLASQGKLELAIEKFEKAVKTSKDKETDFREMAWMYLALKNFNKAYECYQNSYRIKNDDIFTIRGYIRTLMALEKTDEALELHARGLKLFPNDVELQDIFKVYEEEENQEEDSF